MDDDAGQENCVVILALGGIASGPPESAAATTRRLVGFLLAGFRGQGPLPAPSPLALTDLVPIGKTANPF